MTDYIKREDAVNECFNCWGKGYKAIAKSIKALPTADVVEIVRCKDCKHFDNETKWTVCTKWSADPYEQASVRKNDFCSYGERQTNEI